MSTGGMDLGRGGGRGLWGRIVDVALTDVGTLVKGGIDEDAVAELERVLLEADFGVDAALALTEELERAARRGEVSSEEEMRELLARRIRSLLEETREAAGSPGELRFTEEGPTVVLLLGVNGVGKTTTAAKLAHRYRERGVVMAAADTFRAGAQEQLRRWAGRVESRFVGGPEGGDPAAVAYDAVDAARAAGAGLVLVDTAGRLHTRADLMEEIRKVDRVARRRAEDTPHERLLVVDATTGANALHQAREFGRAVELTGVVLAKFDSTARGGMAVAVCRELGVPTRFLGTGESLEDLEPFDPDRYVRDLLEAA